MKKLVIIGGVVLVVLVGGLIYFRHVAKSFSPEGTVDYSNGDLKIGLFYNRPYKKGRVIFGKDKLVPYGKTWRTGANEATTFETNKDLIFGDKELKAGKYSLWTVPNEETWQVVFNSSIPSWGVTFNGEAQRDVSTDALIVEVPVHHSEEKIFEQFTIYVEKGADGPELILCWDNTIVPVPFSVK